MNPALPWRSRKTRKNWKRLPKTLRREKNRLPPQKAKALPATTARTTRERAAGADDRGVKDAGAGRRATTGLSKNPKFRNAPKLQNTKKRRRHFRLRLRAPNPAH